MLLATPTSLALGAAVLAGWYLTLEQVEAHERRDLSIIYAAAAFAAATELMILHSMGAPHAYWPVAATLAIVVGVGLTTPRGVLVDKLDKLAPALGITCCLSLIASPASWLVAACAIVVVATVLRPRVPGQRFLITCLTLVVLASRLT